MELLFPGITLALLLSGYVAVRFLWPMMLFCAALSGLIWAVAAVLLG